MRRVGRQHRICCSFCSRELLWEGEDRHLPTGAVECSGHLGGEMLGCEDAIQNKQQNLDVGATQGWDDSQAPLESTELAKEMCRDGYSKKREHVTRN